MFKKILPTSLQVSSKSSVPSPPSPSASTSPKPTKMSTMKAEEDNQVSPSAQIHLTEQGKYANISDEGSYDGVPDLILPPPSPSEIATLSNTTRYQVPSSAGNLRGHTRDDSLETTVSQSMDLSSFIKSLELPSDDNQEQTQKEAQKKQHELDQKKRAPMLSISGCDGSLDGSLSLAASQVDISLAEDIHVESDTSTSENKVNDDGNSDANKATGNKPKCITDSEVVVTEKTTDHSSSLLSPDSASARNDGQNSSGMTNVCEQRFCDSLKTGKEGNGPKTTKTKEANDTSEQEASATESAGNHTTKMLAAILFVFVITIFVLRSQGDTKADDVAKPVTLSTGKDFMIREFGEPSKPDPQEQSVSSSRNTDSDQNLPGASNHIVEEANGRPNSTGSSAYVSHFPIGDTSSDLLFEDQMNDDSSEKIDISKPSNDSSHGWKSFIFLNVWPFALVFAAFGLFSSPRFWFVSSSCSFKKKVETEVKMETKTPRTPVGASSHRNRGQFLTPPPSCESTAREPTKWMSPCYGDNAIDISVYKAMKHDELRKLLRERNCDARGKKEQLIKMLVMSYQNELACLTVQKLRPKLRRRNLSLKGTKKDIVRRLVEAGPQMPMKA
eukprot:CAMPEP_0116143246 /NCGR_PEP_ID=MMETSP0329-20121206/15346_1 /TAXON_ID=697910 /ORGANISM="Pseudo-nitzschia arenysensis, Strain B593" /LENGTH=613 /DNA_ID=CAMNT_0003638549 /DNA_START=110 /DNA_END=1951 /DNA_ORIENTATION=+